MIHNVVLALIQQSVLQSDLVMHISYIYSLVSQYDRQKWNSSLSTVIDMFYESFEITYSTTKKEIKNIYAKVTDFNIENMCEWIATNPAPDDAVFPELF